MATDLSLPLSTGSRVSGRHYPAVGDGPPRLFVFAHGAGAGQDHPSITALARDLAGRGVHIVTFNFPYMEARKKVPDRAPVLDAVFHEVVGFVRTKPDLAGCALFIGGKSMGGRIATHLAAHGVEGLHGVIALGYPLHPPGKPEQLRTEHLPCMTVPALIVQGEHDAFGTPAELAPYAAAMPPGTLVHMVKGGDHSLGVRRSTSDVVRAAVATVILDWLATRHGHS